MDHAAGMEMLRNIQGDHQQTVQPVATAVEKKLKSLEPLTPEQEKERQERIAKHHAARRRAQAESMFRMAKVPKRHADAMERIDPAGKWMEVYTTLSIQLDEGFLVSLLGPRGTGKTQMAVFLIHDACRKEMTAMYVKAMDLLREIRSSFRDDGLSEIEIVRRYTNYGLLVIDEAHERGHTDFENRTLTNIIDTRYDRMLSTILISNDTIEAFSKAVGPSIVDRLNETGRAIECNWESFRR